MAIKGKTKRSQSRPGRRPTPGPRIQAVERRQPWYKAQAFPVTLAVVVLPALWTLRETRATRDTSA